MIITRERQRSLDLSTLFSWFIIYSCIGWIYETTYCFLTTGRIQNRGFLYGPLCPIYGLCIILMVVLFSEKCKSVISLFISSALVATVLEYVTSIWMDYVFGRRWWNYSKMRFNIDGRVCLEASIAFGLFGILFVKLIHPAVVRYIESNFPDMLIRKINKSIILLLILDILFSFQMSLL
ncbi:MAG TPA: putative ABC transporter permease [Mobilitalea sp.]|nr:putative ABC transporter permease [Mobilitalea sp.]